MTINWLNLNLNLNLHTQHHACWCSGDFRSHSINRHGIDVSISWSQPETNYLRDIKNFGVFNIHWLCEYINRCVLYWFSFRLTMFNQTWFIFAGPFIVIIITVNVGCAYCHRERLQDKLRMTRNALLRATDSRQCQRSCNTNCCGCALWHAIRQLRSHGFQQNVQQHGHDDSTDIEHTSWERHMENQWQEEQDSSNDNQIATDNILPPPPSYESIFSRQTSLPAYNSIQVQSVTASGLNEASYAFVWIVNGDILPTEDDLG